MIATWEAIFWEELWDRSLITEHKKNQSSKLSNCSQLIYVAIWFVIFSLPFPGFPTHPPTHPGPVSLILQYMMSNWLMISLLRSCWFMMCRLILYAPQPRSFLPTPQSQNLEVSQTILLLHHQHHDSLLFSPSELEPVKVNEVGKGCVLFVMFRRC